MQVRDALNRAVVTDRMGTEQDFAEFVNTTLGVRLMPQLAREKSSDDDVSFFHFISKESKHADFAATSTTSVSCFDFYLTLNLSD